MMIDCTLVIDDDRLLAKAKENGFKAVRKPAPDQMSDPLEGKVIVMVDSGKAQTIALELADGGLDPATVEWIDGTDFEGGIESLIDAGIDEILPEARDLYFNEVRPLADAHEEPVTQERIPAGPDWAARNIRFRRRELICAAGPYGCGKSTLLQYVGIEWCRGPGALYEEGHTQAGQLRERPVWFCTWEDDPVEQRDQIMRRCTFGKCEDGTPNEIAEARRIQRMILHTRPELDRSRDLGWYVERARYMSKKYGTNFFILDPWSEFDHEMEKGEQETQYVKKIMKELGKLSVELNAIFVVITHITKSKYSDDMSIRPFRVADAMGSVQFGSTATRGLCVQRVSTLAGNRDHMVVYFDKVKIERTMGKAREVIALSYYENSHELVQDIDATMEAARAWGCRGGGKCGGERPVSNSRDKTKSNGTTANIQGFAHHFGGEG